MLIISWKKFIKLNAKTDCFLECESFNDNSIKNKCLSCNKNHSKKIDVELKKRFQNIFNCSNNDINKFILSLKKGVYSCQYMDDWEKFNETSLSEKEELYSNLNMKDITYADYMYAKRVGKEFKIKKLGEYHDLYLKSDELLLADVFEKVRKMCLKIYHLDPAKFLSAPGLAWQATLKRMK